MRQILILGAIFLLVPLAFFAPFTGLISYVGIAYVRPHEWAYMPDTPVSLAVAVATLTGYVIFELTRRARVVDCDRLVADLLARDCLKLI